MSNIVQMPSGLIERLYARLPVGSVVGAGRWPFSHAHPDCWGLPWSGTLLAVNDPRAWYETLAFPCRDGQLPSQADVDAHVAWCESQNLLTKSDDPHVPVLWAFGSETQVWWEGIRGDYGVRPYEEDCALWERARADESRLRAA
jgi:hypothetical protein